jgi:hypothetical protein
MSGITEYTIADIYDYVEKVKRILDTIFYHYSKYSILFYSLDVLLLDENLLCSPFL